MTRNLKNVQNKGRAKESQQSQRFVKQSLSVSSRRSSHCPLFEKIIFSFLCVTLDATLVFTHVLTSLFSNIQGLIIANGATAESSNIKEREITKCEL